MSAVILFVFLTFVAVYIVWCDERDQFELAVKRAHEDGFARWVYCFADEFLHSPHTAIHRLTFKLEVFNFEDER